QAVHRCESGGAIGPVHDVRPQQLPSEIHDLVLQADERCALRRSARVPSRSILWKFASPASLALLLSSVHRRWQDATENDTQRPSNAAEWTVWLV
ncbi:MAG: hypothetical protein ACK42I_10725, partial [Thermomicrobium sp.]